MNNGKAAKLSGDLYYWLGVSMCTSLVLLYIAVPVSAIALPNLSSSISSSLLIPIIACGIFIAFLLSERKAIDFSLLSILLCLFICSALYNHETSLSEGFRRWMPFLFAFTILTLPPIKNTKYIYIICLLITWLIFAYVLTMPKYYHESEFFVGAADRRARLWPFYGASPHSSGYFASALLITLYFSKPKLNNSIIKFLHLLTLMIGLYLVIGFYSSQAIMSLLAFIGGVAIVRKFPLKKAVVLLIAAIAIYIVVDKVLVVIELTGTFRLESVGSGRIGTWMGRIEDLANIDDVVRLLIGSGPGSDFYIGRMWPKPTTSHNTFLTYLIEFGFLGVVLIIVSIIHLSRVLGKACTPLMLSIFITCMIGNGLLMRPVIFLFFAFATYIYMSQSKKTFISSQPER